jgi:hypothetical protein
MGDCIPFHSSPWSKSLILQAPQAVASAPAASAGKPFRKEQRFYSFQATQLIAIMHVSFGRETGSMTLPFFLNAAAVTEPMRERLAGPSSLDRGLQQLD